MVNNGFYCQDKNQSKDRLKKPTLNYEKFLTLSPQNKKFIRKSIAGYVLATTSYGLSNEDEELKQSGYNLKKCNSKPNLFSEIDKVSVKEVHEYDEPTRHLSNVLHCASPWTCPVCSAKISTVKGLEINNLMKVGRANGRFYSLVVLTIPHQVGQSLEELNFILSILRKKLQEDKQFRAFKKEYKLRFVHVGLELMLSIKDGLGDYHPHVNFVFDFDENPNITELEISQKIYEIVTNILKPNKKFNTLVSISNFLNNLKFKPLDFNIITYQNPKFIYDLFKSNKDTIKFEAIKRKYNLSLKSPYSQKVKKVIKFSDGGRVVKDFIQVKGGVSATFDFKEDYPTKFGLAEEVTRSSTKGGDITKSFHPFHALDFIRFFDLDNDMKKLLIEMFRAYVKTFKGKSLFRFGRGAEDFYNKTYNANITDKTEEEITREEEAKGVTLLEIDIYEWQKFNPTPIQVLTLLNKSTPQEMEEYIQQQIKNDDFKREKELLDEAHQKTLKQSKKATKKLINSIKNNPKRLFKENLKKSVEEVAKEKNLKLLNAPSNTEYLDKHGQVIKPTALKNPNAIPIPNLTNSQLFEYIKDLQIHLTNPFLDDLELSIIQDKLDYANKIFNQRGKNILNTT